MDVIDLPVGQTPPGDNWYRDGAPSGGVEFNYDAMADYLNRMGLPSAGTRLDPGDVYTQAELKAQNAAGKKAGKEQEKQTWNVIDALAQLANQALASSHDLDSLIDNLISGLSNLVNQTAQQMFPGPMGMLLGGIGAFAVNAAFGTEEALPIEDDAVKMKLMNPRDIAIEMAAVRDEAEIAFSNRWQQSWTMAAQAVG